MQKRNSDGSKTRAQGGGGSQRCYSTYAYASPAQFYGCQGCVGGELGWVGGLGNGHDENGRGGDGNVGRCGRCLKTNDSMTRAHQYMYVCMGTYMYPCVPRLDMIAAPLLRCMHHMKSKRDHGATIIIRETCACAVGPRLDKPGSTQPNHAWQVSRLRVTTPCLPRSSPSETRSTTYATAHVQLQCAWCKALTVGTCVWVCCNLTTPTPCSTVYSWCGTCVPPGTLLLEPQQPPPRPPSRV